MKITEAWVQTPNKRVEEEEIYTFVMPDGKYYRGKVTQIINDQIRREDGIIHKYKLTIELTEPFRNHEVGESIVRFWNKHDFNSHTTIIHNAEYETITNKFANGTVNRVMVTKRS